MLAHAPGDEVWICTQTGLRGTAGPHTALREADVLLAASPLFLPHSSLLPTPLLPQGSPPHALSLQVLSVGEEESSPMDESALVAAHLCVPSWGRGAVGRQRPRGQCGAAQKGFPGVHILRRLLFGVPKGGLPYGDEAAVLEGGPRP